MRLRVKWINGWAYAHGTAPNGQRVRRALKTKDARRAEEARAALEARLWRVGLYGPEEVVTFEEAAVAYAEDGGDARFLVPITTHLGKSKLREITPKMVRDAARKAYPKASAATVNRQGITPAGAVINYGHQQGWCGAIRVKRLPVEKPVRESVGRDYLEALRPHLPARLFAMMLFLRQTGRRVSDAVHLAPEDRDGKRIRIGKTKNGEPITVQITSELAAMLDEMKPRHDRLFGYVHRSSVYSTLRRAAKKAGVPYLATHQPGRHSFATELHDAGWSDKSIADAGGWKTVRMVTETYQHPHEPAARAASFFDADVKKLAKPKSRAKQKSTKQGVKR